MNQAKNFNTPKVLTTNLVFPQAVITGDLIFVSGTVGIDTSAGKLIGDNFEEQHFSANKEPASESIMSNSLIQLNTK